METLRPCHAPVALLIGLTMLVLSSAARAQSDPGKVFKTNCVLCHAPDGSGSSATGRALKAKNLRSGEVQRKSDAELIDVITKGRGNMPAFRAQLSTDGIKSLVKYIRQLPKKQEILDQRAPSE